MERLDKLIATYGNLTRSEARRAIRRGLVTVNGMVCTAPAQPVDQSNVSLCAEGRPLAAAACVYLMMNKPQGVICATQSDKHTTVLDLLAPQMRRKGLFPAGRLDKDTTGFVLLTDDGALAHRILAPGRHIPKTYRVVLDGPVGEETAALFGAGLTLSDGTKLQPARLENLSPDGREADVILQEGRYHQIKRMFGHVGLRVTALHRTAMGGLKLDAALEAGQCRYLHAWEVALLEQQPPS